jgi:Xaa-Pro aminopeptidase
MNIKFKKLFKIISALNLDALFITNQHNVSYLTGFTGFSTDEREGFLLATKKNAYLLLFSTYFNLFEKDGSGVTTLCITHNKRLTRHLNEIIKKEKIKSIGFEEENLTIAELNSLQNKVKVRWQATKGKIEDLRVIKDETELKYIKDAARITDAAFEFIKGKIKKGVSEKTLALELEYFLKKNAGDIAFSPIIAFNKNAAIPHYLPTNSQQLIANSLILLDFGAKINGYCADMTRVVFFGTPGEKEVKMYNTVLSAQKKALSNLTAGMTAHKIDKIARDHIISQGFPEYPHSLGHGVGLAIHENPRLKKDSKVILKENMVVTVEPGIYLPGQCGIRIEDLVLLKDKGVEILSKSTKEIVII